MRKVGVLLVILIVIGFFCLENLENPISCIGLIICGGGSVMCLLALITMALQEIFD